MKKRLHIFRAIGLLLILFEVAMLSNLYAQVPSTEFLVPVGIVSKAALSAKVSSVLSRLENRTDIEGIQLVNVGNVATLQKDGLFTFALPDKPERLTFKAIRVEAHSITDYEWHGELIGGPGTVSFLYKNGRLTGSISQGDNQYLIYHLENGLHIYYRQKPDLTKTCMNVAVTPRQLQKSGRKAANAFNPIINLHYEKPCASFPRVLILYTPAAAQQVADINQVANQCISQFNSCIYNSNVSTSLATIELAGIAQLNFVEGTNMYDDLTNRLMTDYTARQLRESTHADIVVLLTKSNYPYYHGMAGTQELNAEKAYAIVVAPDAVGGRHTFSHEVGHLYGCYHNADFDLAGTPSYQNYSHGYQYSTYGGFNNRATIMVNGQDVSFRETRFSNPDVTDSGTSTGTYTENNSARRVSETYTAVNGFRGDVTRPLSAVIEGPNYGLSRQYYTWTAATSCGTGSYTYAWRTSYDGFNFGSVYGTSETYGEFLPCPTGDRYYIRLDVTGSDGQVASSTTTVQLDKQRCNSGYGGRTGVEPGQSLDNAPVELYQPYPNSAVETVQLSYLLPKEDKVQLTLTDNNGRYITTLDEGDRTAGTHTLLYSVTGLPAGLYLCCLKTSNKALTQKLVVVH